MPFVPHGDRARMLQYLGHNVGDHLAGAVANVLADGSRHFEQAVYAEGLSEASVREAWQHIGELWKSLLGRARTRTGRQGRARPAARWRHPPPAPGPVHVRRGHGTDRHPSTAAAQDEEAVNEFRSRVVLAPGAGVAGGMPGRNARHRLRRWRGHRWHRAPLPPGRSPASARSSSPTSTFDESAARIDDDNGDNRQRSDLHLGTIVEVQSGEIRDGAATASQVRIVSALIGTVQSVSSSTLVVNGQSVQINAAPCSTIGSSAARPRSRSAARSRSTAS